MKFSIIKEIDIEKIDKKIDEFVAATDNKNPYIFMNKETANALCLELDKKMLYGEPFSLRDSKVFPYMGNMVFLSEHLGYGEVEIR